MLVVAFLVTTATMYSLNKVASAVSEETAEDVGMVLNQNNSGEDSDVAYSTEEISAESAADTSESDDEENAASSEDASANTSDSSETASADSDASGEDTTDNSDNATSDENSADNSVTEDNAASTETTDDNSSSTEEGSDASSEASSDNQIGENTDSSEIDSTKEGTSTENPTTDNSSTENSLAGQTPAEGENAADKALTSEEDELKTEDKEGKEAEESKAKEGTLASGDEVELTEDVVLTVSYVDEENNSIADEKEISLSESLDFTTEAPKQDGYEFRKAAIDGTEITKITAKQDANGFRYYEVALADVENSEEATVVIKENKTVVLTYSKELDVESEITISIKYVDKDGAEIKESSNLSITDELWVNKKENVDAIEDFYYMRASYNEIVLTAIKPVFEENNEESDEAVSDGNASENKNRIIAYELLTKDGENIKIEEDTEIVFTYYRLNKETEFVYSDEKVTVTATMKTPGAFPEGVTLNVTEINSETEGYNYDAYLKAMNDNADKIAESDDEETQRTFDDKNTLLYDIAFLLEDIEYQPEAGDVSISMKLNEKPLSEDGGLDSPEDLVVIHLPASEEVMENVDSTSKATELKPEDIKVEVLDENANNVAVDFEEESDVVSFDTGSFSPYALVWLGGNVISWEGTKTISAKDIVKSLGDNTLFGAVADTYEASNEADIEANIAVKHLKNIIDFGNSSTVYTHVSVDEYNVTKKSTKDGEYWFALYSKEYNDKNNIEDGLIGRFPIYVSNGIGSCNLLQYFNSKVNVENYSKLFVYEIDNSLIPQKNGNKFQSGDTSYTVTYDRNDFSAESKNDIIGSFSSSYVESNETGDNLFNRLKKIDGNTVYVKNSDDSYTEYSFPDNSKGKKHKGTFPISVSSLLNQASNVSENIALAQNTEDVLVINAIGTKDGFLKDVAKAYKNTFDENTLNNYLQSEGIDIGNKLLVINLDLTFCKEYELNQFSVVTGGGKKTKTGDGWDEIANQIIINPLQRDEADNLHPYQGKLKLNTVSGTILAPKANVTIDTGAVPGSVMANSIIQRREIHKLTVRRFLDKKENLTINNVHEGSTASLRIHKMVVNEFGEKNVRESQREAILQNVYFRLQKEGTDSYIWFKGFVGKPGTEGVAYEYTSKHKPKKDSNKNEITYRVVYNDSAQWTIIGIPSGTYTVSEVGDGFTFSYDYKKDISTVITDAPLTRVTQYGVTTDSETGKWMGEGGNNTRAVFSSNVPDKSYNVPTQVNVGGSTETVQVANYYSLPIGPIQVTKHLTGGNWLDDLQFTFKIDPIGYEITNSEGLPYSNNDPQPMPSSNTVTVGKADANNGVAIAKFGSIPFKFEGVYRYKITEQADSSKPWIKYDTKEYYVKVNVIKKNTTFTKSYTYSKLANPGIDNSTDQTEEFHYLGADIYYCEDSACEKPITICELYLDKDPKTGALAKNEYKAKYYKINSNGEKLEDSDGINKVVFTNEISGKLSVNKVWVDSDVDNVEKYHQEVTAYIFRRKDIKNDWGTYKSQWELYKTIQLTNENQWKYEDSSVPLADESGNAYEYTVAEQYYDIYETSYTYNGVSIICPDNAEITNLYNNIRFVDHGYVMTAGNGIDYGNVTITNKILYVNELPSTGGGGTVPYTITGILMITAALGLMLISRKRKGNPMS